MEQIQLDSCTESAWPLDMKAIKGVLLLIVIYVLNGITESLLEKKQAEQKSWFWTPAMLHSQ